MGRRPAYYAERTPDNVMHCLRVAFGNKTAFEYNSAAQLIIRDFACQRRTANSLLMEAINNGSLLVLTFMDGGALWKATNEATGVVTETNEFPRFVRDGYGYYSDGLRHTNNDRNSKHVPDEGNTGLAFPDVFAGWHAQHTVQVAEDRDRRSQERQEEIDATRAAHPALAPLDDFSNAWAARAAAKAKMPPVSISIFQNGRGTPFLTVHLNGQRTNKAAADLLAVLQEHFSIPE